MWCVQCRKDIEPCLVTGKEIYKHRPDLYSLCFYKCPYCNNSVGCHKGTKRALGCIPNGELKKARRLIHQKLDLCWKTKKYGKSRRWWYASIAKELGIKEYHTGNTRTIDECRKVWNAIIKIKKGLDSK